MTRLPIFLLVVWLGLAVNTGTALSMVAPTVKGSAAKPFDKQKVAVFGAGGYLGGCIYGFLQRCGSLYGTGIQGIRSPRAITATSAGSLCLNGILGKHFVLAQADESFVKLTDATSVDMIESRLVGFDAVILATRYTLEQRPVTGGSYGKTPNDKTMEFYMDRPRSSTVQGTSDPEYCLTIFQTALRACQRAGIKKVVVVETDGEFLGDTPGSSYLQILEECNIPYTYIYPAGKLDNIQDYTYAKGVQSEYKVTVVNDVGDLKSSGEENSIHREDLAALCVQVLLSLDWSSSTVLRVERTGADEPEKGTSTSKSVQQEWCVNSNSLATLLNSIIL